MQETCSYHSITIWLDRLATGDPDAVQPLWEKYFAQLVDLAKTRMRDLPRRASDEEDVALSAFHAFCQAVTNKRIPQLKDREDLWRTLVLITVGKAIDERRRHLSQKRGGGRVMSAGTARHDEETLAEFEALLSREPDPALAAQLGDDLQVLLTRLPDAELQQIAVLKLEGFTNEEIAERIGCSLRSVARRLVVIRRTWDEVGTEQA